MAERSCLCGSTTCGHGRRRTPKRKGAYGGAYQSNRAVLMARWNGDPETRCHLCGRRTMVGDPWEPDHFLPVADGGGDHLSNLRPAHRSCNRAAGARLKNRKAKEAAEARARARQAETRQYLELIQGGR